jgi:ABC-type tungstate transport system substrate-binding protein
MLEILMIICMVTVTILSVPIVVIGLMLFIREYKEDSKK